MRQRNTHDPRHNFSCPQALASSALGWVDPGSRTAHLASLSVLSWPTGESGDQVHDLGNVVELPEGCLATSGPWRGYGGV
jgi:hypothetical protein